MKPKWTIAIATNPYRAKQLDRLLGVLLPQVDKYKGQIEVLIFFNNFEYSLGYLRQCLLDEARGEYISHIDDDDLVKADYCDAIFPLLDGVDYVGFMVDYYDNGVKQKPVYHSLKYTSWYDDEKGYYRGVTHLNPVRTEVGRLVQFPVHYATGEDEKWSRAVPAITEHYIDRPMYEYWHRNWDSVAYAINPHAPPLEFNPEIKKPHDTPKRPVFDSPNIRFHPRSTPDAKTN